METGWTVIETQFDPTQLHHKETVFTLGNGYLSTRGSFEEGYPGAWPTTFIHGVYDDVPISYTELANCPDWLSLVVLVEGDRFRLDQGKILGYQRYLNLRSGILNREVRWQSSAGHQIDIHFERFVSLLDEHVMALRCQITPLNFEGSIEIQSSINGYPETQGILHWEWLNQSVEHNHLWLQVRSRHSEIELGMASKLTVSSLCPGETPKEVPLQVMDCQGYPTLAAKFWATPGQSITVEKVVTVFTSRDVEAPILAARTRLASLPTYSTLLAAHITAWAGVWQVSDVVIEGDDKAQLAVHYSLFQLLAAAPRHDDRVSIPAKTLSGFGYKGHIFWDTEIFIVPFLTFTQPALARNLLTYHHHTLPGARRKAKAAGYEGAMFAWESAVTGDEVTPSWVPSATNKGELIRIWCGDIELHINADIAYAIWHYWQATGDNEWMRRYGAEIVLDTAIFWGSRVEWNAEQQQYELNDVIGPDENHDHVNNNVFTNRLVQWHLETALKVLSWLRQEHPDQADQLQQQLDLSVDRLDRWVDIMNRLFIHPTSDDGLIEQCDGFFDLKYVDLETYEPRDRSMQAILGIEETSQRQILKQADVLMLIYLLRDRYNVQTLQANWDYYVPRTDHTHGSSLGPPVHAILACELGKPEEAYKHFMRTALVDLEDVRGNAKEGIHAASAGGVWQTAIFGFGGIHLPQADALNAEAVAELSKFGPIACPSLPPGWTRLKFQLHWRGQRYDFDLQPSTVAVQPHSDTVVRTRPISEAFSGVIEDLSTPQEQGEQKMPIRGVIFDLDGVLTDTSEFHYQGWKRLADDEGLAFDREANEALRGISRRDSLLQLLGDRTVTEAEFQEMMDRKNGYYLELIENITPTDLLPGALELLNELQASGVKVAIGSVSKNAQTVVQRLGIQDKVEAIADGYSVTRTKPAPDLFLYAAEQLGLSPVECVVVEDATSGVEAALTAGMLAVGLGPVERVGAAHVVLPDLAGVSWADLQAWLRRVPVAASTN